MKVLLALALLAVVSSAPVSDQEQTAAEVDQDDVRVKRAKEVMMFGNQQNEANKEKRSEIDPGTKGPADKEGLIVAKTPVDLEQPSEDTENSEQQDDVVEESVSEPLDNDGASEGVEDTLTPEESDVPDSAEVGSVAGTSEQAESNENSEEQDTEDFDNYFGDVKSPSYWGKYYNLLKEADDTPSQYDKWASTYNSYNPYGNFGYRYRRSQMRRLRGQQMPRARVLKRSRRIKRDLVYPSDILDTEYLPYNDEYLPYAYPSDEDEVNALLGALQDDGQYLEEDEPYVYAPYDQLSLPELEDEPKFYYPKRQAGLNFVPGIKRSRDFYPYYEEPATHFSAFVPTKRSLDDYADAYERVMELAAALRRDNYYPEGEYGYEGYDNRRRK